MRFISDYALAIITIWQEARGEPQEGKIAVAEVIRNRMKRKYSSDGSVTDTVLRPYQFSGWNTKDPNRVPSMRIDNKDPVVNDCIEAWLTSEHSDLTGGAVLYLNEKAVDVLPDWVSVSHQTAKIGRHSFYIPMGGG